MIPLKKVVRNGKVAVVHSDVYCSWASDISFPKLKELLMFSEVIVELVEKEDWDVLCDESELRSLLDLKDEDFQTYYGDDLILFDHIPNIANSLQITWVKEGSLFLLREYDGMEWIETEEYLKDKFIKA